MMTRSQARSTTAARKARAAQRWREGASYAEIAAELSITTELVATWLRLLRQAGEDLPRRKAPAWTAGEEQRLVEGSDAGVPVDELAAELGRPLNASIRRLSELRTARGRPESEPVWDPANDEQFTASFRAGATLEELRAQFGVSRHVIEQRIRTLRESGAELPERKPRWTDEQRKRLAKRYRQGASLSQLEREFDRTTITSQLRTLRRLGYDVERRRTM